MSKKIIGGLVIVMISLGGITYLAKANMENREASMVKNMQKVNSNLLAQLKFEQISSENGLFESTGTYKLSFSEKDTTDYNGNIIFKYKASHDFYSFFGGDIKFTAKGKVDGEFIKKTKLKSKEDNIIEINGLIKEDGSISSTYLINDFSFVIAKTNYDTLPIKPSIETQEPAISSISIDKSQPTTQPVKPIGETGMIVSFIGAWGDLTFTSKTGDIKNNFKYASITAEDLEDSTDKLVASGINGSHNFNINSLALGEFVLKMATINNGTDAFTVNGIELFASVNNINNKFNIKFDSKVSELTILNQKKSSFELGYSINGIDNKMMTLYKKATTMYASGINFSEKDQADANITITDSLKSGLSFSIDKIKFKNQDNSIDFNGHYEILPTLLGKDFTISGQSKFGASLTADGELAQMANNLLSQNNKLNQDVIPTENPKQFKVSLNYENGIIKVNNGQAVDFLGDIITTGLKNLDLEWGFIKADSPAILLDSKEHPNS